MYQGKSGPHLNTKRRNPLSLSPEAFFWAVSWWLKAGISLTLSRKGLIEANTGY